MKTKENFKRIVFSLLSISLTLSIFSTLLATTFNMTNGELDNAIAKFNQDLIAESKDSSTNSGIELISRENDTIKIKTEDEEISIKYDFTDSCKFYIDTSYTTSMNYEQYEETSSTNIIPALIGFPLIADSKGYSTTDSMLYVVKGILDSAINSGVTSNTTENISNMNAYQAAKKTLENIPTYSTELFKINFETISDNGNEIIVRSSAVINHDADFSILEGYADKIGEDIVNIFPNKNKNENKNENITLTPEKDKDLPKAGIEINYILILKATLILAIILLFLISIRTYIKKNLNFKK